MAKTAEENTTPMSEKLKALQAAMSKIEKDFGRGSVMKLGDEQIEDVEVIPTGSLALNAALGVGGYPKGRIIEIYGPESSGKTTLAIHAIAEAQKRGGIAAFIDAEHAFDRFYAKKLGVDVDELLISQPDNGEQALEIADQLIRSSAIDIISSTRSLPTAYSSWSAAASWDSAPPTSQDSSGRSSTAMTTSSRWTPTSLTTQPTCRAFTQLAMTKATTSPSDHAT